MTDEKKQIHARFYDGNGVEVKPPSKPFPFYYDVRCDPGGECVLVEFHERVRSTRLGVDGAIADLSEG